MSVENNLVKSTKPTSRIEPRLVAAFIASLVAVALIAFYWGRGTGRNSGVSPAATEEKDGGSVATSGDEGTRGDAVCSDVIKLGPEAVKTAGIQTAVALRVALPNLLTVPGTITTAPSQVAQVTPPVSGKIIALCAAPGDAVKAGQSLVLLDSPEVAQTHAAVRDADARVSQARAGVQTAEAEVEQARTRAASAQAALDRQRDLTASGQIAQPSLQAAQSELTDAQAALKEALASLALAQSTTQRVRRLFEAEIAARSELEQAQTAQQQAQIQAERAESGVTVATAILARERRVYQSGLLNRQVVQKAEADLSAAQGEVRQARKQVQAAQTTLAGAISGRAAAFANLQTVEGGGHALGGAGRLIVEAPLSGVVTARSASMGQAVERSTEIMRLQNTANVLVEASVPEASVAQIRIGATVTLAVAAYPGKFFQGVVESFGGEVEEKTRTLPVRCRVPNANGQLRAGMFARVALTKGNAAPTLTVPDAAVDEDGDKRFVYVAKEGGFEKRSVGIGRQAGDRVEIVSGLQPGEKVVTEGMFVVKSESKKSELEEED